MRLLHQDDDRTLSLKYGSYLSPLSLSLCVCVCQCVRLPTALPPPRPPGRGAPGRPPAAREPPPRGAAATRDRDCATRATGVPQTSRS